jgi:hypothetical protein
MRLSVRTHYTCLTCSAEQRAKGLTQWEVTPETGGSEVRLTSEPVALNECKNGHRSVLVFLDGAYALVFERALQRVAIGSPRDAVMDAYTAFEMFLAHVPARARYDREKGASPLKLLEETKAATKDAQRSLGGALATVSIVSRRPPPKVNEEKTTALRNRAVHAGVHPSDDDAAAMCLEIERLISEFEECLAVHPCENSQPYWDALVHEEAQAVIAKRGWVGLPTLTRIGATVLAMTRPPLRNKYSAAERIATYRKNVSDDAIHWRVW